MMIIKPQFLRTVLLSTAVALSIPLAAVGGVCAGGDPHNPVLGITQDPDPVPMISWSSVEGEQQSESANPDGDDRGDGRSDVAFDPLTDRPLVVWAYHVIPDYDIAFSEWNGEEWQPVTFLTSSLDDEIDPRIFVDLDGTVYVVWWVPSPVQTIYLARRPASSGEWGPAEPVAVGGRRPSVAAVGDEVLVAFERDAIGGGQEIVVQSRNATGGVREVVVATTESSGPLDVVLHSQPGKIWIEWQRDGGRLGYAEYVTGSPDEPMVEVPSLDAGGEGEVQIRKRVRRLVFSH